jgi:long-subunit fatty acid transport protein
MLHAPFTKLVAALFALASISVAQEGAASSSATASAGAQASSATTCSLNDGKEISVRYNAVPASKEKIANGKPFTPGGAPMTLFTETRLAFGNSVIPIGAYTLYPIPGRDHWTLAVNKNVTAGSSYDEKQDLARAAMETAQVSEPGNILDLAFAHVGSRCTLRIYFGKTASFADFTEKQ